MRPKAIEWPAIARHAYDAYRQFVGGKSVRGEALPDFEDMDRKVREAWIVAAKAVAERV